MISTSIADIFFSNALKNGLVPVRIDARDARLAGGESRAPRSRSTSRPGEVRLPDGHEAPFAIDPFARHCLLNGVDELGYLLSQLPAIEAWERREGDAHLQKGDRPLHER